MERALKERLVGAVVLVALGVWLIPLFLDGPPAEQQEATTRALSLPVPGEDSEPKPGLRTQTIAIDGSRGTLSAEAKKTAEQAAPPEPANAQTDESSPKPVKPKPRVTVKTPPEKQPAKGSWFVQLGSFGSEQNARRLAKEVDALGWDARVSAFQKGSKTMHRVRVGPSPTRSKAESLASELARRGFAGQVMAADS